MSDDLSVSGVSSQSASLPSRLKEARALLGLSQADVAKVLRIPRTAVVAIEAGTRKVAATELQNLSRLYRRPVSWLLGEEEPTPDEDIRALYRVAKGLTDGDREQVLNFARFLAGRGSAGVDHER